MIRIENVEIHGWEAAIRGMRNPMNSWERSDSEFYDIADYLERLFHEGPGASKPIPTFVIGPNDHALMMKLAKAGSEHAKYRRMIEVWCDITCPAYVAAEIDTYKVGTVRNSCSLQHKGASRDFTLSDFSVDAEAEEDIKTVIGIVNKWRNRYVEAKDYSDFIAMRQLMPMGYNYLFTFHANYETLSNMYRQRKNHKLPEWREFCKWIKTLPYSEIITLEDNSDE